MFKRILLPVDLTDKHDQAIHVAGELARQSNGTVTLLHVIEIIPGLPMEEDRTFYDRLERVAQTRLDRLGKQLAKEHVSHQAELRFGNRVQECVGYGVETKANLIILTAPRVDAANAAGWGSMGYRIGILSQCPVLLVK